MNEIQAAAFTEKGKQLAMKLFSGWEPERVIIRDNADDAGDTDNTDDTDGAEPIGDWVKQGFEYHRTIVFIGAVGIAVRLIAPYINNKLSDSPVIVIDELGLHVIPVLSGHIGGANSMALRIAAKCGADPVITTATDIGGLPALDVWASENDLSVKKKDGIKSASSRLLSGGRLIFAPFGAVKDNDVVVSVDEEVLKNAVLPLKPRLYAVGIGCRKGQSEEKIEQAFTATLNMAGITGDDVFAVCSADIKKNEPGILAFCGKHNIKFLTYSAEELMSMHISGARESVVSSGECESVVSYGQPAAEKNADPQGSTISFSCSAFVYETTGIDCVCERAAVMAAGDGAELVLKKQLFDGVTAAVAKRSFALVI